MIMATAIPISHTGSKLGAGADSGAGAGGVGAGGVGAGAGGAGVGAGGAGVGAGGAGAGAGGALTTKLPDSPLIATL